MMAGPSEIAARQVYSTASKEIDNMKLHNSRNDLESNTKAMVSALLNARLADAIDLALSTKQAHWNLRGRQFIAVHEMLDGFRTEIDTHADTLAERVVQLGVTALGTAQIVVQASRLRAYPTCASKTICSRSPSVSAISPIPLVPPSKRRMNWATPVPQIF